MIIRFWSHEELVALDEEIGDTGASQEAGWCFQYDEEDAPIGPYPTEAEAREAAEKDRKRWG